MGGLEVAAPQIELILARSLAAHLSVAAFLVDADCRIVYFNEAAELLLGCAFEDYPSLGAEDLIEMLDPRDEQGQRVSADAMPLPRALVQQRPSHLHASSGRDGGKRYVATAVPFIAPDGIAIGAMLFWYEEKA